MLKKQLQQAHIENTIVETASSSRSLWILDGCRPKKGLMEAEGYTKVVLGPINIPRVGPRS